MKPELTVDITKNANSIRRHVPKRAVVTRNEPGVFVQLEVPGHQHTSLGTQTHLRPNRDFRRGDVALVSDGEADYDDIFVCMADLPTLPRAYALIGSMDEDDVADLALAGIDTAIKIRYR